MTKSQIHTTAIIENGARIADTAMIGPFCHIGPQVTLDDNVVLYSHVVIMGRTTIGAGTRISPFSQLGGAPQHLDYKGEDTALIIGKNNIIRENVTMNLGTVNGRGETRVGDNGLFMVGVHIAHDCVVRDNVIFANNTTLGGHVIVEDYVFIGGLSAIHQFCHIGAHAFIGGCSAAIYDIIPYGSANGNYADLVGLNLIGMKRRDFSKTVINDLRSAYRLLFAQEGCFQERLEDVSAMYHDHTEICHMIEFIKSDRPRPIMMPKT